MPSHTGMDDSKNKKSVSDVFENELFVLDCRSQLVLEQQLLVRPLVHLLREEAVVVVAEAVIGMTARRAGAARQRLHVVTVVPDPQRLVDEMTRVCKPSGQVVIINHFSSRRPLIRGIVNLADPVTRKLGWSTKLSLDDVMDGSDLNLESRYKTSPWSLFTIVEARKFASAQHGN